MTRGLGFKEDYPVKERGGRKGWGTTFKQEQKIPNQKCSKKIHTLKTNNKQTQN